MRLDRLLTKQCRCSQKQARLWVNSGSVTLNEHVITDYTQRIRRFDRIVLRAGDVERIIQNEQAHYIMLHKPAGVVSATSDPVHQTVIDLITEPYASQLHIAGRLDATSTGLLLLTNDGAWSKNITQAKQKTAKIYWVETESPIDPQTVQIFKQGLYFATEDITTLPVHMDILAKNQARLTLHEGRYHQIRRMFARVNNRVVKLHREQIGSCHLGDLPAGDYKTFDGQL